ncbi:MAG: U32 family peptidase [Clostridiales bacterium]|nr:U32 family peptidase [Clostridiales bacterium]
MLEILAPAGSYDSALAAINNGANAIYLGLSSSFSARQGADNFDADNFRSILFRAHLLGVKVYVALNTVIKDGAEASENFFKDVLFAWNEGADAIILQDPFLGKTIHESYPDIVLHMSTQAGVCTLEGAKFAKECGFSRVILARETPLAEIKKIAEFMETEVFIHGALCTCFSGQCYFSSFVGGNSGNRGRCKQPCRKRYAYDRNENTALNYALSLSDLGVGEDIEKLKQAGVVSFKIEGRMRRPEYVAAAVRYYRGLLDETGNTERNLSALKRTYNRGNYTKGLAFGQDKRFLSTAIQGHIGEKVGVVKVLNAQYFVDSRFIPQKGDAFKIIRDGGEIGGASFVKTQGKGFIIDSKIRLKNGDNVFITTDTEVNTRVLAHEKRAKLHLSLEFTEGQTAKAVCGNVCVESNELLQSAQNRPLSEEEIRACFIKTDGLPLEVVFDRIEVNGNIFIPKSMLNGFRRTVYERISDFIRTGERQILTVNPISAPILSGNNTKTAVISDDFADIVCDIAIYKPQDWTLDLPESFVNGNHQKYLYYPAFATSKDMERLEYWCEMKKIDGIYAENYGGMTFAKEHGVKLFAGTGFNLTNQFSVMTLLNDPNVAYYAVSKELNQKEGGELVSDKAFALASGNIKIMDLCYCPFGKTCNQCDKREIYGLTDENGRVFPVRRYLSADGNCRFEVYNCADLVGVGIQGAGKLLDVSVLANKSMAVEAKDSENKQKQIYKNCTSGHYKRGVL